MQGPGDAVVFLALTTLLIPQRSPTGRELHAWLRTWKPWPCGSIPGNPNTKGWAATQWGGNPPPWRASPPRPLQARFAGTAPALRQAQGLDPPPTLPGELSRCKSATTSKEQSQFTPAGDLAPSTPAEQRPSTRGPKGKLAKRTDTNDWTTAGEGSRSPEISDVTYICSDQPRPTATSEACGTHLCQGSVGTAGHLTTA